MLDAVIVGAGHNGLVAAAYLARAGLCVEVLERRDIVGGALRDRGAVARRARLAGRLHAVAAARARSSTSSTCAAHGLEVDVHEPYLFAPLPDGRKVVTWSLARAHPRAARARLVARPTPTATPRWSRALGAPRPRARGR